MTRRNGPRQALDPESQITRRALIWPKGVCPCDPFTATTWWVFRQAFEQNHTKVNDCV